MGIQQIIGLIDDQIDLIDSLAKLSKEKEKVIIKNEIEEIESINNKELELIEKLNCLEEERQGCLEKVGIVNKNNDRELLNCKFSSIEKELLDKKENEFKAAVRLQIERNRMNDKLIKLQLSQINIMLNSVNAPVSNTYSGQGQVDEGDTQKRTVFEFSV